MAEQHDELATKKDLDQLKQELVAKIDGNGAKIDANSAKIDQVEQSLTAKIDGNGAKIDANTATLSRVSHQVVENHEQIGRLLSMSKKFNEYFDEVISSLDGLARSVSGGEQERTAMNARLGRVDEDVDENKNDITKIKAKLAMPQA